MTSYCNIIIILCTYVATKPTWSNYVAPTSMSKHAFCGLNFMSDKYIFCKFCQKYFINFRHLLPAASCLASGGCTLRQKVFAVT